jgi:hypothetical protein
MRSARSLIGAIAATTLVLSTGGGLEAQPSPRVATTVAALLAYPVFFHGRTVIVQGDLHHQDRTVVLIGPGASRSVYLSFRDVAPDDGPVEVTGELFDLGRLTQDDPRLTGIDVEAILQVETQGRWPSAGDLLLIRVSRSSAARPAPAPSVRAVALDPARYEDQRVTVVGRFRGANLYGDLPQAPAKSRWDFVLQSADAALWVTDLRPRGNGLDLSPTARVDTGRWVEVDGVVKREGGLVWLVGQAIRPAKAPSEPVEAVPAPAAPGPPPEVIFSAPIQDDTDISPTATVRIQFSRDMKASSFADHVRASYFGAAPDAPEVPAFRTAYRDDARVLEITFEQPLERFRTVRIDLLDGIESFDGVAMKPWSLTFSVGAG